MLLLDKYTFQSYKNFLLHLYKSMSHIPFTPQRDEFKQFNNVLHRSKTHHVTVTHHKTKQEANKSGQHCVWSPLPLRAMLCAGNLLKLYNSTLFYGW